MHIENVAHRNAEQLVVELQGMDDSQLLAQEITQKAGIHVLRFILATGNSQAEIRAVLRSLERLGSLISAECRRRGLAVVDHPAGN